MTMGARLRRRSPPPLRQSSSEAVSSSSTSPFPSYIPLAAAPDPPVNHPSSTIAKWAGLLAALVSCAWLVGMFIMMSLHRNDGEQHLAHFPIPLSSVRGRNFTHTSHHKKHTTNLPKHYMQLSPPTTTTKKDSPPWSWPIIHIVSTRFMQGQGSLINLARSRLKLLEVVCLPSLMQQTIFDHDTQSEVYQYTKWEEEVNHLNEHHHSPKRVMDPLFLWIIKVDPNIDQTILNELNAILEPVKQFTLVVGSNTNYGIGIKPGGWRDGQAGQNILDAYDNGRVFFPGGDVNAATTTHQMLRRAHDAREDRVVIETRLDADDAVNVDYIAALQTSALRTLVEPTISGYNDTTTGEEDSAPDQQSKEEKGGIQTAKWLYWCPHAHVQWNPSSGADGGADESPGMLQVYQMPMTCVTAGLSLGFAVGTAEEDVPRYEHSKIYWEIAVNHNNKGKIRSNSTTTGDDAEERRSRDKHDCGLYPSEHCAVFVKDPMIAAFRSRAVTSAGMHNIEARGAPSRETPQKYKERAAKLWEHSIRRQFGIETARAKEAADFMLENHLGTVRDNLRGQCTHGHSCKMSSLEKLQMTIDILEEEIGGVDVYASVLTKE